jgi:hypothetical protein
MPSFLATARSNQLPSKGTGNVTSETQILGADGKVLIIPLEGSLVLQTPGNARRFKLSIAGYMTSGTTSTVTLKLYFGTSTTISSNGTAMFSITTASLASTNQNFFIDVWLVYDSVSGSFGGNFFGSAVNTLIDLTAITQTSVASGIADSAEGQGFTLTAIFNSTNASNNLFVTTAELIPE